MQNSLKLENIEFMLHLGATAAEQEIAQKVVLSIEMRFDALPAAVHSDVLADTICYAGIEEKLRVLLLASRFNLIEHLGYRCYKLVKNCISEEMQLKLSVTKFLGPPHGSRTFVLGFDEKSESLV